MPGMGYLHTHGWSERFSEVLKTFQTFVINGSTLTEVDGKTVLFQAPHNLFVNCLEIRLRLS